MANQIHLEIANACLYTITIVYVQGCAVKVVVAGVHFLMPWMVLNRHVLHQGRAPIPFRALRMCVPYRAGLALVSCLIRVHVAWTYCARFPEYVLVEGPKVG